jgi:hypothetical protein
MTNIDRLPYVEAELNYLAPVTERPRYYAYEIGAEERPYMPLEPHRMKIHDMRPVSGELKLDKEGFELIEQRSAVRDFWDDDEVRKVYYPEAEAFIKQATGASRVFIFDHPSAAALPAPKTARREARASQQPASMSTIPRGQARSGRAICSVPRPMSC